jgi:hypothetical protein
VLSELPEEIVTMTVEEALRTLLDARVIDSTFYFECRRRHAELARWIEAE